MDYELMFSNLVLIGHNNTWRARSTTFITNNPCLAATLREEQSTVTINAYKVLYNKLLIVYYIFELTFTVK